MNRMPRFLLPAIAFGAALIAFPFFFLKLALFGLFVGGVLRFIGRRALGGGSDSQSAATWGSPWQARRMEFTDRIRTMSDAEYAAYTQKNQPQRTIHLKPFGDNSEDFVL